MPDQAIAIPTTADLLESSAATSAFKDALLNAESMKSPNDRVRFSRGNPPVKVVRAISGLLEHSPALAIDRVEVSGASGCSDYRGEIVVNGGERRFRFVWDCAWKASEMGWTDFFGEPDQIRAARTFGYRCFEVLEEATP